MMWLILAFALEDKRRSRRQTTMHHYAKLLRATPTALLMLVAFLPLSTAEATPFLAGHSGSVWMGKTKNTRLLVATMEGTACSLFAPDADAYVTEGVFTKNTVSREMHSEQIGSETERMFAVSQRDPDGGADLHVVVMLKYSLLQSVSGVEMTAMPASQFPGVEKYDWPQLPSH
jgi:hypothetical protein